MYFILEVVVTDRFHCNLTKHHLIETVWRNNSFVLEVSVNVPAEVQLSVISYLHVHIISQVNHQKY